MNLLIQLNKMRPSDMVFSKTLVQTPVKQDRAINHRFGRVKMADNMPENLMAV